MIQVKRRIVENITNGNRSLWLPSKNIQKRERRKKDERQV